MKYLLVIAVVLVAFYVWRSGRQAERQAPPPRARKPLPKPGIMVACKECGTHLPESESISGRLGPYCCPEHREQREGHGG
ncbi:PP0621 family protein [Hydrogenophaga sp.]|uniref:PP0621 family protein n=1 Tax=Hydrogenophaga sp. TaxID=1904254 RepID=UPI0025C55278|nr:PP0621 family protein [Hydrogenophaga sp.]